MATIIGSLILILALFFDILATAMLMRSDFETPLQKTAQLLLLWLLPFVGSAIVITVLTYSRAGSRPAGADNGSGASSLPGSDGDLNQYSDHSHLSSDRGNDAHSGDIGHHG